MSFTDQEKTNIRRHCGYPVYGSGNYSNTGYIYTRWYLTLESRMNNLATAEETLVRETYLVNCATLEAAIVSASANLDTNKAAVWEHNRNEVQDRINLYNQYRMSLCQFLGIPAGPGLQQNQGISFIV